MHSDPMMNPLSFAYTESGKEQSYYSGSKKQSTWSSLTVLQFVTYMMAIREEYSCRKLF
jgi:hypothetical protein